MQLSQELGIPLDLAEQILDQANVKKVNFGPFDYRRLAESTPGLRDLDRIAYLYIKGFSRKVGITRFLKLANQQRPKIQDEHLRRFAKRYIDQYSGKSQSEVADAWIARTQQAVPLLRDMRPLSAAQIAGAATGVQFMAKLGFNLFSPVLNLTQTLINTVPGAGLLRTFGRLPASAAAVLLPNKLNPFVRELAKLKRSGVLDSLNVKFERVHLSGWGEKAQNAMSWLFDKSEQFNRACAFLAAYDQAKAGGKTEAEALRAGRELVRVTQFFSGRLDSPLFARTPLGRVVMQFKVFTLRELEFVRRLTRQQKLAFALMTVALGGPASFGIQQTINHYWPSSDIAHYLNVAQEKASVAGLAHADHLAKRSGIFMVPGIEDVGGRDLKGRVLAWAAGPTFSSALDTVAAAFNGSRGAAARFLKTVTRGFAPGGAEAWRVERALRENADDPVEFVRTLFGFYRQRDPAGAAADEGSAEVRRLEGR